MQYVMLLGVPIALHWMPDLGETVNLILHHNGAKL